MTMAITATMDQTSTTEEVIMEILPIPVLITGAILVGEYQLLVEAGAHQEVLAGG